MATGEGYYPADLAALWEKRSELLGPTLLSADIDLEKLPLCATCPAARWFQLDGALQSYCKEFREKMWPANGPGVTQCDAYVLAVAEKDAG
jgi:hypothetical protein